MTQNGQQKFSLFVKTFRNDAKEKQKETTHKTRFQNGCTYLDSKFSMVDF